MVAHDVANVREARESNREKTTLGDLDNRAAVGGLRRRNHTGVHCIDGFQRECIRQTFGCACIGSGSSVSLHGSFSVGRSGSS